MKNLNNLEEINKFLIEHENVFNNNQSFTILLNKSDNPDELPMVFFEWWEKHSEFRSISVDIEIVNKFIEYYNGVYQLKLVRNSTIKRWVSEGILNEDETVKDEYVEQGRLWFEILTNNGK